MAKRSKRRPDSPLDIKVDNDGEVKGVRLTPAARSLMEDALRRIGFDRFDPKNRGVEPDFGKLTKALNELRRGRNDLT
jgi:predicted lipoprotein